MGKEIINNLWVIGDSFSTGWGLDKTDIQKGKIWSSIIAKNLKYQLVDLAEGGIGNEYILSTAIDILPKVKKDDFVIIGLSDPLRLDIYDWNADIVSTLIPGSDFVQNGLTLEENFSLRAKKYIGKLKTRKKRKYSMFEKKGLLGPIDKMKSQQLRELTLKYFALVRSEGLDYLEKKDIKKAISIQKALKRLGVKSFLWSWHKYWNDYPQHLYKRLDDGHFALEGHEHFAERVLDRINKGITYWENIYE